MIIERIKQLFKKIFSQNKMKYIEAAKIEVHEMEIKNTKEEEINNFKEDVKLENNKNYRIINLQKEFKEGNIKAEEISKEDTELLISLYLEQIRKQLKEISEYEVKIKMIPKNN